MTAEFVIRSMTRAELDTLADWAACEGWNPGRNDLSPLRDRAALGAAISGFRR